MIVQITGVCISAAVMCIILRQLGKGEAALLLALSAGVYVLWVVLGEINKIVEEITLLSEASGLDGGIFSGVLKITGTACVTGNAASLCRDSGESSLAEKIELGGKIIILSAALPSVKALFEVIANLL